MSVKEAIRGWKVMPWGKGFHIISTSCMNCSVWSCFQKHKRSIKITLYKGVRPIKRNAGLGKYLCKDSVSRSMAQGHEPGIVTFLLTVLTSEGQKGQDKTEIKQLTSDITYLSNGPVRWRDMTARLQLIVNNYFRISLESYVVSCNYKSNDKSWQYQWRHPDKYRWTYLMDPWRM